MKTTNPSSHTHTHSHSHSHHHHHRKESHKSRMSTSKRLKIYANILFVIGCIAAIAIVAVCAYVYMN